MRNFAHFSPAGPKGAKKFQRLQRRLFLPELRECVQEIREILLNTEQHIICNLSFGFFNNTDIVGYVFTDVETESLFLPCQDNSQIAALPVLLWQRFGYLS